jgi:xylulokinase
MGLNSKVIRVGNANMFLSPLFREAFTNTIGARLELYDTDGAKGAALGAGIGSGVYTRFEEAFRGLKMIRAEEPDPNKQSQYLGAYKDWLEQLDRAIF